MSRRPMTEREKVERDVQLVTRGLLAAEMAWHYNVSPLGDVRAGWDALRRLQKRALKANP